MRIIIVGAGTIGSAAAKVLQKSGHEVATVGRTSGDLNADLSDIKSLKDRPWSFRAAYASTASVLRF
jgi:Trk K+ transport system NAD-binding subunit